MHKIQLSYRGVPYTRNPSRVAPATRRLGKYRGRQWSTQPLDEEFVVASTAPLKYRGVEYFGAVRPYALSGLLDRPWVEDAAVDNLWLVPSTSG